MSVPARTSLLDERLGDEAYGVFAPPSPERMDLERDDVRPQVAAVLAAEQIALANTARVQRQIRTAVRDAHGAGARVTQLAAAFAVSRQTIYQWLGTSREDSP